jgi:hypothetical protein
MSKKPSKAKRSRARTAAKPVRAPRHAVPWMGRFLWDQATGQLFDRETRLPLPVEPPSPPPTAEEIAARRERVRQQLARDEAKRVAFRARLARRPVEMQRDEYVLPADVAMFLRRLHCEPTFYSGEVQISTARAIELISAAYMEGCRQGFIEGFLYGEDHARPGALKNRERLRQQNLEKLERLGIADRNAEIVAEFHRMERDLPGKEQRYEELAARHELTTRQIGTIIRKASTRRR